MLSLKELKAEINRHYNAGNTDERDLALQVFVAMANEEALKLSNMRENFEKKLGYKQSDQVEAMSILDDCVKILSENSNKLNPFSEMFYETYNNLDRC